MDPESERHRCIAESLIELPRYLSRDKIRLFGVDGVAEIVASVVADPDENTRALVDEQSGLRCSVCEKLKHQTYYGWNRYSGGEAYPVCRYCRWRIKTKANERYRKEKGLPPKPKKEDPEERKSFLGPEQIAALDEFLRERENRPPDLRVAQVQLSEEAYSISSVYGPGFANISSGWYSTSEDENYGLGRKQLSAWWTDKHDAVIEWFLRSYGMFVLAACRSIEVEIKRLQGTSGDIARYFDYFVLDRVRTQRHLWNLYASDFLSRYRLKNTCASCGATEPLIWIHHENLEATTGRVLPLCNLHWKTYRRAASTGGAENISVGEIDVSLDSALRTHRCPVCETDHSWKDKTYTYTDGFYGIPEKYREICFDCFNASVNEQQRSYSTKKDLEGVLEISRITEELPADDAFRVITQQAKTLEAATSVVRLLKEMVLFGTLKRRYGSWFAVLARSGCLPEGSRKEVYGTRILAKDGHECLSMAEMQIDDELHGLRIPHRKEVRYPNASFVCDWVVSRGDDLVFIEFFGLSGRADYDEKIVQKRAALVQAGLELIELYQEDLLRLKERLGGLVSTPDRSRKRKSPSEP